MLTSLDQRLFLYQDARESRKRCIDCTVYVSPFNLFVDCPPKYITINFMLMHVLQDVTSANVWTDKCQYFTIFILTESSGPNSNKAYLKHGGVGSIVVIGNPPYVFPGILVCIIYFQCWVEPSFINFNREIILHGLIFLLHFFSALVTAYYLYVFCLNLCKDASITYYLFVTGFIHDIHWACSNAWG